MKLKSPYLIKPHQKVRLSRIPTAATGGFASKEAADAVLTKQLVRLDTMQELFYASQEKALLIVLQGMDTAGKDGTIRHIFSGVNPQGCNVAAFKVPTSLELRHDFLWRVHQEVPPRGMIGIFNRSHYEDVLSPRVHKHITDKVARQHIDDINEFEETLTDNGVVILKFFLHISKAEQGRRLQSRLDDKEKHWKVAAGDFVERKFWPQYQSAYEEVIGATSKKDAPWFVIPADHKWYRNVAISEIIVQTMEGLKLKYPKPTVDVKTLKV